MSSERKIRASRANGAKSRGPKTPESKARSSKNSLRHGLLARTVVLEDENLQSFTDLLIAVERDLDPQNEIERALAENVAISRWRLLRLLALERATLKIEMDKHDPAGKDPCTRAALAFRALSDETHSLELLNRYEARIDRQFARSLNLLLKLRQGAKPAEGSKNDFCQTNLVPNPDTNIPLPPAPESPRDENSEPQAAIARKPRAAIVGQVGNLRPIGNRPAPGDRQSPCTSGSPLAACRLVGQVGRGALRVLPIGNRPSRSTCKSRKKARPSRRARLLQLRRAPLPAPLPSIFRTLRRSKIPGA